MELVTAYCMHLNRQITAYHEAHIIPWQIPYLTAKYLQNLEPDNHQYAIECRRNYLLDMVNNDNNNNIYNESTKHAMNDKLHRLSCQAKLKKLAETGFSTITKIKCWCPEMHHIENLWINDHVKNINSIINSNEFEKWYKDRFCCMIRDIKPFLESAAYYLEPEDSSYRENIFKDSIEFLFAATDQGCDGFTNGAFRFILMKDRIRIKQGNQCRDYVFIPTEGSYIYNDTDTIVEYTELRDVIMLDQSLDTFILSEYTYVLYECKNAFFVDPRSRNTRFYWKIGDACEVHLKSTNEWIDGKIMHALDEDDLNWNTVTVKYELGNKYETMEVNRFCWRIRPVEDVIQMRKSSNMPSDAPHETHDLTKEEKKERCEQVLSDGDACIVYSRSDEQWCRARICFTEFDGKEEWLIVQYQTDRGRKKKRIQRCSKFIKLWM